MRGVLVNIGGANPKLVRHFAGDAPALMLRGGAGWGKTKQHH